jgi:hypoxanthine phosphoribosyltransferase
MRQPSNREVERVGQIEDAGPGAGRPGSPTETGGVERTTGATGETRQQTLPLPWQLIRAADEFDERDFAHPAEREFSRILTFYRIRWSYEPTTFSLAFSAEGRPSEMFTPDFYLPEHGLYIELTTMRQRLVTRKNRKIRRLRELYPNIRIKLLYRRDCERLGDAYRLAPPEPIACRAGRVVFGESQIHERIAALAAAIAAGTDPPWTGDGSGAVSSPPADRPPPKPLHLPNWQSPDAPDGPDEIAACGRAPWDAANEAPLLVLGVNRGSAVFAHHLSVALEEQGIVLARDRVTLTRHRSPQGERRVRIGRAPRVQVAGRRILLVADVVSTGLSLAYLTRWLRRRGARQVEICTLLDRQAARLVEIPVRYVGFEAPNELLVGFGLHLRRQFRHLPYIASLVTEPIGESAD